MARPTTRKYNRHGMTKTPAWRAWNSMMDRCYREGVPNYGSYGGRGITVCERWHTFANFYADMGDRPEGMSLDRIDNDGPYSPDNCRWATSKDQARNRRNNNILALNGEERCIKDWSELLGIHPATIRNRLRRGATAEQALQPVRADRRLDDPIEGGT